MIKTIHQTLKHICAASPCIIFLVVGCAAWDDRAKQVLFEFRLVLEDDTAPDETSTVKLEVIFPSPNETAHRVLREPELIVKREDISQIVISELSYRSKDYNLVLHFSPERASDLMRVTSIHVGKRLAIVLGNCVLIAPKIMEPITNGQLALVAGFSLETLQQIAKALQVEPTIERTPPPPEDKPRPYKHERTPLNEEEIAKIMVSDDWVALRHTYIWSQPTETSSPMFLLSGEFFVKQEVQILSQSPWIKWEYQNDWVKVVYDDKKGWVLRKDLIPQYTLLHTDVLLKYYKEMHEEWAKLKKDPKIPPWQLAKLQQTLEMYKEEAIRRFASVAEFQKWYQTEVSPEPGHPK